jgi:hypothetical protein
LPQNSGGTKPWKSTEWSQELKSVRSPSGLERDLLNKPFCGKEACMREDMPPDRVRPHVPQLVRGPTMNDLEHIHISIYIKK